MRPLLLLCLSLLVSCWAVAQSPSEGETTCTFADGKQVSLRYPQLDYQKSAMPDGQPWPADSRPIYLFTQANLTIGNINVPAGAYGVYTVPGKKDTWEFVVTRDVKQDGKYDQREDLGRTIMQTGTLPNPASRLTAYFGRIAPQTCTLRLDYGNERGYTDFNEK